MPDKRSAARRRTFLKAEIDLNGISALPCRVRDLNEDGARLEISPGIVLPDTFRIRLPKPDRWVSAHVRWRQGGDVGIKFETVLVAAAPDPASDALRIKVLEAEVLRLRTLLEEVRADPAKLHALLDTAA